MSYNITITRNNIPKSDKDAWRYLEKLEMDETGNQSSDFLDLIEKFKLKFPCICDLPDDQIDNGVWSDGQLSNDAGENLTTLGIVYSAVEKVLPTLINTAIENGFVVFDYQTEIIYRTLINNQSTLIEIPKRDLIQKEIGRKSNQEIKKTWWKFW